MPAARPPLLLRGAVGTVGAVTLMFIVAVMLSDRAPGVFEQVGGDLVTRVSERIDTAGRWRELAAHPRVPPGDTVVHIVLWGSAVVFVGLAVWRWGALVLMAALLFALSVVVELAQGRLTDTRVVAASDVLANAIGIAAGTVVVAGCYVGWSALAALFGGRSSVRG